MHYNRTHAIIPIASGRSAIKYKIYSGNYLVSCIQVTRLPDPTCFSSPRTAPVLWVTVSGHWPNDSIINRSATVCRLPAKYKHTHTRAFFDPGSLERSFREIRTVDFLGRVQDATSNNIGDRIRDKTVRRMKNILHKRTERETFLSFHSSNKLLTEIGE